MPRKSKGGSSYDSLIVAGVTMTLCTHGRVSGPSSLLDPEAMAPCGNDVPCQLRQEVPRHGRGVLWAGGDPCMTECLECSFARPVLAQSWSQTATDGAGRYSTTSLLIGRDRSQCLCVLKRRGSETETRRTGKWRPPSQAAAFPVARAGNAELNRYPQLKLLGKEVR